MVEKHLLVQPPTPFKELPTEIVDALNFATEILSDDFKKFLFEEIQKVVGDGTPDHIKLDNIIKITSNLISPMYPEFDEVAKRLYLYKLYKEGWGLTPNQVFSGNQQYPSIKEVLEKGIELGHINKEYYNRINRFSELGVWQLLDGVINPQLDLNFTFKGLHLIIKKYALKVKSGKSIELPQHIYLRVALQHFIQEFDKELTENQLKDLVGRISQKYKYLANRYIIEGSPKMINSLTVAPQMSSCILMQVEDDTWSILETAKLIGIYSKYSGGIGLDISRLRASNSPIKGNRGKSKGGIPFVKIYEQVISAFDQMGLRKGACCITYSWWHKDSPEYTFLKDAGGSDENRARRLQYAIKWNRELSKRIVNNEDIYLFDPQETPNLLESWGSEFSKWYKHYEQLAKEGKITNWRKIPARELAYKVAKVRYETGNLYITFVDNINEQRLDYEPVFMSNLCQEVVIPSKPPTVIEELEEDGLIKVKKQGEIGLCNLASINLVKWYEMGDREKEEFILNTLEAFDNLIDNQFYPVLEGKVSNLRKRPIGIGVFNYAYLLAKLGIDFTSDKAKEITHWIFEDLSWWILWGSTELAKRKGTYDGFEKSKWAKGLTPIDVSILHNKVGGKRPDLNYPLYRNWNLIRERIKKYGVRFSYHMALPPTATSSRITGGTEGIEPPLDLFTIEEGTYNLPSILPEIRKYRTYYTNNNAWNIPAKTIIELSAIRQKFIDQAQSITLYYPQPPTAKEIIEDIIYAESLGLKTLYYLKTKKSDISEVVCESCVL